MPLSAGLTPLELALEKAFEKGMEAMDAKAQGNTSDLAVTTSAAAIRDAGGKAFAAEASKAINTFIQTGLVTTAVVTAGSAVAQTGTGTGAIT